MIIVWCTVLSAGSELSVLDCGKVEGRFYYYIDMFSGWNGSIEQNGQFRENIALCSKTENGEMGMMLTPGISISAKDVYSTYQGKINEQIDELIEGVSSDTLQPEYPDTGLKFSQAGGIHDLSIFLPVGERGVMGASFWRPLALGGELIGNSVLFTLTTDTSLREDEETKVVLGSDLLADIEFELNQSRLGYIYKWTSGISAGLGLDIYDLQIKGDAYSKTEGFIRQYGGDTDITQAFNDPQDSEYYRNTLDNEWRVDYEEVLTGFNTGLTYQLTENAVVDIGLSQSLEQELSGESVGVIHRLGAVDYDALVGESEGELFDELLLEPSRMTYTNQETYTCRSLIFKYPGLIRLGLSFARGRTRHQLSMATYSGELSFRYKGEVEESGREKADGVFGEYSRSREVDYTYGVKLNSRMEYDLNHYFNDRISTFLSVQIYNLEEVSENIDAEEGTEEEGEERITLVTGNMGLSWQINSRLQAECRLIGFPGPFLQSRITYKFGTNK